ncbi:MAG TPA: pantoate--beta-alanine ligase [Jatrophihabitans sp.]|nr:pantoate--beta-alanine ligase [Jatrophihabitans sp.]
MGMQVARTRAELAAARAQLPGPVGLVPTMGALHAGHLANIAAARARAAHTVVSIFVNPMQFDRPDDLARYPRPLADDLAACERAGVDLVWAPEVEAVYRGGRPGVWITAGALADQLEGPNRPGHFDGMLTVVAKLLAAVRPELAFFGEKDYQQLTLIRRMALDLDLGVEIVGVPTVRDPDGLALSSRNVFLSATDRAAALALSRALLAARDAHSNAAGALAAARAELAAQPALAVEYLELRDPDLGPAPASGPARLLVAARVGSVRLIDNLALELVP